MEEHRRQRLLEKLNEQLAMAEADLKGELYELKKRVWVTDESGNRQRVERPARLRRWWAQDADGTTYLTVRYGPAARKVLDPPSLNVDEPCIFCSLVAAPAFSGRLIPGPTPGCPYENERAGAGSMASLKRLNLVAELPRAQISAEEHRRQRLLEKLNEQLALIEAYLNGEHYEQKKRVWITDESGIRQRVEKPARLRRWWVQEADGTTYVTVRYGNRPIELEKGKPVIKVGKLEEVPNVLRMVIEAVNAGELDQHLISSLRRSAGRSGEVLDNSPCYRKL